MTMTKLLLRSWVVMFAVVAVLGTLAGCTTKKEDDGIVLRFAQTNKLKGMDPVYTSDLYSSSEVSRVYEGLLTYHYLKRPYVLRPLLAQEMPTVSYDKHEYTFKVRPGIMFHDDAAFPEGKGREVTAEDFVYSLKRLADPVLQSTGWWLVENRIKGLDEWRESMKGKKASDYSIAIEGLTAPDKYTFKIILNKPYPQLLNALAMPFTSVVAREAVEKYGKEFINHAVGTGPFTLESFRPNEKVTYVKNPGYWGDTFPTEGNPGDASISDAGKKLPFADRIEVSVIVENQPRWMNFLKGNIDLTSPPKDNFKDAINPDMALTEEFKKKGINLSRTPSLDFTYTAFNLESEVIPQFKDRRIRRAISLALSSEGDRMIKLFYNGQAVSAETPVPPGISGHMSDYGNPWKKGSVERAKKILAEAGYPKGKGFPVIPYDIVASTSSRQIAEFQGKALAKIGLKTKIIANTWPEFQKRIQRRQAHFWGIAWGADYPDAENFLQLFYGPNAQPGGMNGSYYRNAKFDREFEKARLMGDSPVRTKIYERLAKMIAEDVPVVLGVHRISLGLTQPWLKNYKYSEFPLNIAKYLRVDLDKKKKYTEKK